MGGACNAEVQSTELKLRKLWVRLGMQGYKTLSSKKVNLQNSELASASKCLMLVTPLLCVMFGIVHEFF